MYYNAESALLLDNHVGVSKYDADIHAFIPVAPISKHEQRLLTYMMAHEDRLVSRDTLLSHVWAGRIVSDNSINVCISRLRRKLRYIEPHSGCLNAIRNAGFMFSARGTGLTPVVSLDFLLSTLRWSKDAHHQF